MIWPLASLQQPHAAWSQQLQQQPHASSSLLLPQQQQQQQQQSLRGFASTVQVNPTMPPELSTVITEHAAIKAERPPAPPLEPRPLLFESRRSGVIAIKAGMMQVGVLLALHAVPAPRQTCCYSFACMSSTKVDLLLQQNDP
jgi:hypothetical protein